MVEENFDIDALKWLRIYRLNFFYIKTLIPIHDEDFCKEVFNYKCRALFQNQRRGCPFHLYRRIFLICIEWGLQGAPTLVLIDVSKVPLETINACEGAPMKSWIRTCEGAPIDLRSVHVKGRPWKFHQRMWRGALETTSIRTCEWDAL